jgi:hypothetical protein
MFVLKTNIMPTEIEMGVVKKWTKMSNFYNLKVKKAAFI